RSLDTTLHILEDYCQIERAPKTILNNMESPYNAFVLGLSPHSDFNKFKWCLKGTEIPDRYDICYMPDNARYMGIRTTRDHITFVDYSAKFDKSRGRASSASSGVSGTPPGARRGVDLPSPELLRMHCAIAHVLHLSGAAQLFRGLSVSTETSGYKTGAAAHVAPTGAAFIAHIVDEDPYAVMELREALAETLSCSSP
ncbi:uncharacterized protein BXZ73DRAFT_53307, partial [Epithele typhae]|uniref:uncharacterized protein n=1 Tax=Epithele typhae TaxID=378194 RepID=UPI002007790D